MSRLEAAVYGDLSVAVTKDQLNTVVMNVLEKDYKIFWGFKSGKMILNIYNYHSNSKLTFIRHKGFLELIHATIASIKVKTALDDCINFSNYVYLHSEETKQQTKELLYEEIDHYLMKLFEEKKRNNPEKIAEIKQKLANLHMEWQQL